MLTEIRGDGVTGEMGSNIEGTIAANIIRHRYSSTKIFEKFRKRSLEIS
jgi:hypothetical protein